MRLVSSSADRLKEARIAAGYATAKQSAEAMGVSVSTYIHHENGTRGYPASRAERYARFFKTTPEWLLYGRLNVVENTKAASLGPQIYVQGAVAAGVFKERMEYDQADWEVFTGAPEIDALVSQRFGLRVVGSSMDLLYPPGTILECVRYWGRDPIPNGKRVIVQRVRLDGGIETTVKEYQQADDGVVWLVPRSTKPEFQSPIRCDQPEAGIKRVEVIAIVVASIRRE